MEIGWELEKFPNKETRSFPYLLDMATTVKDARTRMERLELNFGSATLPTPLHIPTTFRDVPSKIEGVVPEHRNVCYVYYNKIVMIIHKAVRTQHFSISYSDMLISNLVTVIVFLKG